MPSSIKSSGLLAAGLALALSGSYWLWSPAPPATESVAVSIALGGGDQAGYQRADQPRLFAFPLDHGPHPLFRNEWWYVTGNLTDATGRQFGYQLTLFRLALAPSAPVVDSAWRTNQMYMGHFALTDVGDNRHDHFERFSRGAVELAGAQAEPFRVWLENWQLIGGQSEIFPMRIHAQENGIAIDLTLNAGKPIVLQGDRGWSQKSAEPGNASYYYSYTRLPTAGTITVAEQTFRVHGHSWLDREWSTSALGPEQSGWDWFALQLSDGRDLMFYRLRRKGGGTDSFSKGMLVSADGQTRPLRRDEVVLHPLGEWRSARTGDRYPAGWRLQIPAEQLDLTVTPKIADQEMRLTIRYWEGAVTVNGRSGQQIIDGEGYLEMTRYADPP